MPHGQPTRSYRYAMWFFVFLGVMMLIPALRGVSRRADPIVAMFSVAGFLGCLLLAAMLGAASRRKAIEQRQQQAVGAALVLMATMLNKETDESLEALAGKGGPAGEAAALLLESRHRPPPLPRITQIGTVTKP